MSALTPAGQHLVQELAQRHGFAEDAVTHMLGAVVAGNGRMAQFSHPAFGGSGQWMAGGMLMIGDMFNQGLQSRVGALCIDIAESLGSMESPIHAKRSPGATSHQSQHQSQHQGARRNDDGAHLPETPFFESSGSNTWWPSELGAPSASGSQNSMRYAWFADARRLAVEVNGNVTLHDTLDHQIGGFSQQQGSQDGISVTSQHGTVELANLPVVSRPTQPAESPTTSPTTSPATSAKTPAPPSAPTPALTTGSTSTPSPSQSPAPASPSTDTARSVPAANEPDLPPEPVEQIPGVPKASPAPPSPPTSASKPEAVAERPSSTTGDTDRQDPLQLIERLGQLHERGLLTDEEFSVKKGELLSRL